MKIVAGLGSVDAYPAYVQAGADEVFCGYVPEAWAARYGMALPLNRREVRFYQVQLGARSELRMLMEQVDRWRVPVTITLNSLHYIPEQYPMIAELAAQCIAGGVHSFIVADLALLVYLHQAGIDRQASLHVSGEIGEINRGAISLCRSLGARRIIFHRKTAISDMAALSAQAGDMEREAFVLNEMCHFNGALCNSLHCDELVHMCRVPYRLGGVWEDRDLTEPTPDDADPAMLGRSGCGLCALRRLQRAGVTHLKVVGRGAHPEGMVRDIAALRRALTIAESPLDDAKYVERMKHEMFPEGCGGMCYYR